MRALLWIALVLSACVLLSAEAKKKRKFEGDFEFAEEDEVKSHKKGEKKRWIHDPKSDLCGPLNCKKKELCLLEDAFTAACVNKKELQQNGDIVIPKNPRKVPEPKSTAASESSAGEDDVFYDSEDDDSDDAVDDFEPEVRCKPCPVVKPSFHCGADNRTYSSLCRLDYHNCIHKTSVRVACRGFCPCKDERHTKQQRQDAFVDKLRATFKNKDSYNYVPQDFTQDNKHYKYIKYAKSKQAEKDKHRAHNEVLDVKPKEMGKSKVGPKGSPTWNGVTPPECSTAALEAMGNRLLDWFSVLMADGRKQHRQLKQSRTLASCKTEVKWMFAHLDTNYDNQLSMAELYDLEHDKSERCLKPFLDQCNLDRNGVVTVKEWCQCFDHTERPCTAYRQRINKDLLGSYSPDCDATGFYRPTQCHMSIGTCWCVDKHGVEFANTRTRGKPDCSAIMAKNSKGGPKSNRSDDYDQEEDSDDINVEGSAEKPVDF